jgi:hypothetical protein
MLSVKRWSNDNDKEMLKYIRNVKLILEWIYFLGEGGVGCKRRASSQRVSSLNSCCT